MIFFGRGNIILTALVSALLLAGCGGATFSGPAGMVSNSSPPEAAPGDDRRILAGFRLSPQGFPNTYGKTIEFMVEVGRMPDSAIMFRGPWRDDAAGGSDAGELPRGAEIVARLHATYGYTPIIAFTWRQQDELLLAVPENDLNRWSNTASRDKFRTMLVQFAAEHKPPYLFLGYESNLYLEHDPHDYAHWLNFYNSAYDAIKQASPETMVGTVFQYEHLAGRGRLNGWTKTHWEALTRHDLKRIDIVGITLYPWLNYETPQQVTAAHLQPLFQRIGGIPVAITETGWPADHPTGLGVRWQTSPEAQAAYIESLTAMLAGRDVRIVNWTFLHPMAYTDDHPATNGPLIWQLLDEISLYDRQGHRLPAYDRWLQAPWRGSTGPSR